MPGILLLPPPATPVTATARAERAAALPPVAPPLPVHAERERHVASDYPEFRQSHSPPRDALSASGRGSGGAKHWLPASPDDAGSRGTGAVRIALPFLAQQIAQEALPSGLYREPWALGLAAYQQAGGEPPIPTGGPALVQLSA